MKIRAAFIGVLTFVSALPSAWSAEAEKFAHAGEIVRKVEDGKQYCYESSGYRVPCPLTISESTLPPDPSPACKDDKLAWTSGYLQGLSGTAYHASLVPRKGLRLRSLVASVADHFEVPACQAFLSMITDGKSSTYQCCLDAYYRGAEHLWKKADDFYALNDAAKAKLPERERVEMEQCYRDRTQGAADGAQQCDFYASMNRKLYDPGYKASCPRVEFWMVDYRGCYMMGFLSQVTFCDCPYSDAAMANLRKRAPQIYQHREDRIKALSEDLTDLSVKPGAPASRAK